MGDLPGWAVLARMGCLPGCPDGPANQAARLKAVRWTSIRYLPQKCPRGFQGSIRMAPARKMIEFRTSSIKKDLRGVELEPFYWKLKNRTWKTTRFWWIQASGVSKSDSAHQKYSYRDIQTYISTTSRLTVDNMSLNVDNMSLNVDKMLLTVDNMCLNVDNM